MYGICGEAVDFAIIRLRAEEIMVYLRVTGVLSGYVG
jgi:hypothetical protein